jgi:hypothetical protein
VKDYKIYKVKRKTSKRDTLNRSWHVYATLRQNICLRINNRFISDENGYCFIIPAERDKLTVIRPAKYRFSIDSNLIQKLKENKVGVRYLYSLQYSHAFYTPSAEAERN